MTSSPDKNKALKLERRVAASRMAFKLLLFFVLIVVLLLTFTPSLTSIFSSRRSLPAAAASSRWNAAVRRSAAPSSRGGPSVLVTGAAGFVGFHCSMALKRRGDGVVGIDNFNAYYDPSLKRDRASLLAARGVFIAEGDVADGALLAALFSAVPFTHVLHLAGQAGIRLAMDDPLSYVHSNVAAFVSLLEAAAKKADPQPAIVWASSSLVYGLNDQTPFCETHRTDRPASLYAATKKAGEEIAHVYNHIYGLSLTALRFFTVYGPWGRPDMTYFSFTRDILAGKPVTLFGAAVTRDFIFIDDVVNGCLAALDTAERSTGDPGGGRKRGPAQLRTYNLGSASPAPVTEMVALLERLLGVKARRRVVRMPENGDVARTHANVTLAHRELGYKPTTGLAAGLGKFVEWYVGYYGVKLPPTAAAATLSSSSPKTLLTR